jgi:hypothetical protein
MTRDYRSKVSFCASCRREARDLVLPTGWLRVQRRSTSSDDADAYKIVGLYCGLPCLAADVKVWIERFATVGGERR